MAEPRFTNFRYLLHEQNNYQFLISTIPTVIATSILSPLTRLKIILQVMPCISIHETEKELRVYKLAKKIVFDQGLFSLWRGNLSNCYRIIIQNYSLIYIDSKLSKNKSIQHSYTSQLYSSILSSTLSALFSYPFEIAFTRMTSDMTRYGHKRLYGTTIETLLKIGYLDSFIKSPLLIFPLTNYYKGFTLNIAASITYYSTLLFIFKENRIRRDYNNIIGITKKFLYFFGPSFFGTLVASAVSYPLDTLKRQIQVNGSLGFNKLYFSIPHAFKMNLNSGIQSFYKGFSVHILKMIPYSFILHLSYSSANEMIKTTKD